jgi:hypothetical protein
LPIEELEEQNIFWLKNKHPPLTHKNLNNQKQQKKKKKTQIKKKKNIQKLPKKKKKKNTPTHKPLIYNVPDKIGIIITTL